MPNHFHGIIVLDPDCGGTLDGRGTLQRAPTGWFAMLPPGDVALPWDVALLWNVTWLVRVAPSRDVALSWHVAWCVAHGTIGACSDVGERCGVPPTFSDANRQNTRSEMQNLGRYLVYATPDHTDYRRYPLPDFLLV
jgi:hypothetical protein